MDVDWLTRFVCQRVHLLQLRLRTEGSYTGGLKNDKCTLMSYFFFLLPSFVTAAARLNSLKSVHRNLFLHFGRRRNFN